MKMVHFKQFYATNILIIKKKADDIQLFLK